MALLEEAAKDVGDVFLPELLDFLVQARGFALEIAEHQGADFRDVGSDDLDDGAEFLREGQGGIVEDLVEAAAHGAADEVDDLLGDGAFAREVDVEGLFADAEVVGEVVHRERAQADAEEALFGGREDALGEVILRSFHLLKRWKLETCFKFPWRWKSFRSFLIS